jgi:outer membrane lipoprotein-sorting protein
MKSTTWILAACAALIALPAHAQTAEELIAKNLKAKGGLEKIKAVKSVRASGHLTLGGMDAPFVMTLKRPNEMRMEVTVQGTVGVQGYDGKTAWAFLPFMGQTSPAPLPAEQAKMVEEQADFDGPLVDYKAKGVKVETAGRDTVEGLNAYKLKVTRADGQVRYLYLDPERYLEIKTSGKRNIAGTEVDVESRISDYKDVGGVLMAHSIESGVAGTSTKQKFSVDHYELNVDVAESAFAMPAAADTSKPAITKPVIEKKVEKKK